ncbi:MAG: DUF481 domain-containing protein [Gammaproteobacteria bacterium]|jgi:putative salt-induced outer membrane protein|nr:DUF481 domain-containing protein [Gammaproteobacteria bacterium]HJP03889.1 DUF481 domain-containing protein [Gammaproteobacteria bacterium]
MSRFTGVILLWGLTGPVCAGDGDAADEDPWSGEVAVGYIASSGNTDSTSGTARVLIGYVTGDWEHEAEAKVFGASEDEETTAENYQAWGKSLKNLTERSYAFGRLEWKKNRFSGYPEQTFETVGYGRRVLDDERFQLNFEVGAGWTQQDKLIAEDPDVIEDEDSGLFTLGGDFTWTISETSSFEQLLLMNSSSDNTYWESITRLKANVIGGVALAIGYTIQGNSDVEAGTKKADKFTSISLEYSF